MAAITVANMRSRVLLHKLILFELLIGGWQSFNIFWAPPAYGWWLSTAAVGLHLSTGLHNVIAWVKIRPFLSRRASMIFIGSLAMVQSYWILEIYATFAYFNNINEGLFPKVRPVETLFRDPWWIASCGKLLWVIKSHYNLSFKEVVTVSPRFAVMLVCIVISLIFIAFDILSVKDPSFAHLPVGVNPFWRLALVFKCLTDTVILDDFKTALDRLWAFRRVSFSATRAQDPTASAGGYASRDHNSSWTISSRERGPPPGPPCRAAMRQTNADLSSFQFRPRRPRSPELSQHEMQPPVPARGVMVVTTWKTDVEPAEHVNEAPGHVAVAESYEDTIGPR